MMSHHKAELAVLITPGIGMIDYVAKEAITLAKQLDCKAVFIFNDTPLVVTSGDTVRDVLGRYRDAREGN